MATLLKTFPPPTRLHYNTISPKWLDGRIWKLKMGRDFTNPNIVWSIRMAARRMGVKVKVGSMKDGAVVVQALKRKRGEDGKGKRKPKPKPRKERPTRAH